MVGAWKKYRSNDSYLTSTPRQFSHPRQNRWRLLTIDLLVIAMIRGEKKAIPILRRKRNACGQLAPPHALFVNAPPFFVVGSNVGRELVAVT